MAGTLGESLALITTDNLGWALRSWKYELLYNGIRGSMVLDGGAFGPEADRMIRSYQTHAGLAEDGIIGPNTGQALLEKRIRDVADAYGVARSDVRGIVAHESGFDLGAVGVIDPDDRGPVQEHIYPDGSLTLSQAIRPARSLPRLGAQLSRVRSQTDDDTAVASWNVGEGGAEWWFENGQPASGSPPWWPGPSDLSARCTVYVKAVRHLGG